MVRAIFFFDFNSPCYDLLSPHDHKVRKNSFVLELLRDSLYERTVCGLNLGLSVTATSRFIRQHKKSSQLGSQILVTQNLAHSSDTQLLNLNQRTAICIDFLTHCLHFS